MGRRFTKVETNYWVTVKFCISFWTLHPTSENEFKGFFPKDCNIYWFDEFKLTLIHFLSSMCAHVIPSLIGRRMEYFSNSYLCSVAMICEISYSVTYNMNHYTLTTSSSHKYTAGSFYLWRCPTGTFIVRRNLLFYHRRTPRLKYWPHPLSLREEDSPCRRTIE